MDVKEFNSLLRNEKYQVFLFSSPVPMPYFFAAHTWFVINKKGKVSRWEFGRFRSKAEKNWGNVHLNVLKNPLSGMNINPFKSGLRYNSKLISYVEGSRSSVAFKLLNFLEKNSKNYPYKNNYQLLGPNSNTFTQWVLNKFPKSKFKLPWNAFGKNYCI